LTVAENIASLSAEARHLLLQFVAAPELPYDTTFLLSMTESLSDPVRKQRYQAAMTELEEKQLIIPVGKELIAEFLEDDSDGPFFALGEEDRSPLRELLEPEMEELEPLIRHAISKVKHDHTYESIKAASDKAYYAVSLIETFPDEVNASMAVLKGYMGQLLYYAKQFKEGEALIQEALWFNEQAFGKLHAQSKDQYHNLGWMYHAYKKYGLSLMYFEKALAAEQELHGPYTGKAHTAFQHVLMALRHEQDDERKKSTCAEALYCALETYGQEHIETALCMNNVALICCDMKDFEQAKTLWLNAFTVFNDKLGPKDEHTLQAAMGLKMILDKHKDA